MLARRLAIAGLVLALPALAGGQAMAVLRLSVVLTGVDGVPQPIRRHLLLVSDNPSSAPPRRVFTGADGTAELRVRPGSYTIESDQPVVSEGRTYHWIQSVEVVAGRDLVVALTAANAEVGAPVAAAPAAMTDRASLAARWDASVVEVWTPTQHASGTVVDVAGLVVTTHYGVGEADAVAVQLSRTVKVRGQVVAFDPERDLAVVHIGAGIVPPDAVVPLGCDGADAPVTAGDDLVVLDAPLGRTKGADLARAMRVASRVIESDLAPVRGAEGGPVFSMRGAFLGVTSAGDERMRAAGGDIRVVRAAEVCAVVAMAKARIVAAAPAPAIAVPVEPVRPYPTSSLTGLDTLLARHPPYQLTAPTFEVAFLTPLHIAAGRAQRAAAPGRTMRNYELWQRARLATDFANWADYVGDTPPVLFVRVTPRLVESLWMKLARGAAYTQGVALPAIKRLASGFASLRAFCGEREVQPIHPFLLQFDVPGDGPVAEGLYAFEPGALTPACGTVRLELVSRKSGTAPEVVTVEPKIVAGIWADFAVWRAQP